MPDNLSSLIQDKSFLRREQVRLLYESIPSNNLLALLLGSVLCLFIIRDISTFSTLLWLCGMVLTVIIRAITHAEYKNSTNKREQADKWHLRFIYVCVIPMAVVWSLLGILYFPLLAPVEQMAVLVSLLTFSASSMSALSVRIKTYILHIVIIYAPIIFHLLANGHTGERMFAILLVLIMLANLIVIKRFHSLLTSNIFYQAETQRLLNDLKKANTHLSIANENLQTLSITDETTNIANRRYFNQRFAEIWADHVREKKSLAALMIDVDFFKDYNDTYGHPAGDHCLQKLASALRGALYRPRDFIARYGGEEFIVLLPNTHSQGAEEIAARMHEQVKKMNIEHLPKGIENRITISIGIAYLTPSTDISQEDFIQQADQALYSAKNNGRNQSHWVNVSEQAL